MTARARDEHPTVPVPPTTNAKCFAHYRETRELPALRVQTEQRPLYRCGVSAQRMRQSAEWGEHYEAIGPAEYYGYGYSPSLAVAAAGELAAYLEETGATSPHEDHCPDGVPDGWGVDAAGPVPADAMCCSACGDGESRLVPWAMSPGCDADSALLCPSCRAASERTCCGASVVVECGCEDEDEQQSDPLTLAELGFPRGQS